MSWCPCPHWTRITPFSWFSDTVLKWDFFLKKSKNPFGNWSCTASMCMPFSRSINLWAVGQLASSPFSGEMATPLWPSVIVASQMLLEMNLPRQYIGMTYLFPSMWRNVLAVTVLMMCNFSQPFWWLGLAIGPRAILQESLLMPVWGSLLEFSACILLWSWIKQQQQQQR